MDVSREVFPNAPLAMVVAEIRLSYTPELSSEAMLANALSRVRHHTPVMTPHQQEAVDIQVAAEAASTTRQAVTVMEARSLDQQTTAAVSPQALNVAMSGTAYTKYEESLRPLIEAAYSGLIEAVPHLIVTRIGLRYLDEIRVQEPPENVSDWDRWISPGLLGGASFLAELGGVTVAMRSTLHYALPRERRVTLSYGPFHGGGVVGPGHPFHKAGPDTDMFVIDLDSSWTPGTGVASMPCDQVLSHYDELHRPSQSVFAETVTEEARELFRGKRP